MQGIRSIYLLSIYVPHVCCTLVLKIHVCHEMPWYIDMMNSYVAFGRGGGDTGVILPSFEPRVPPLLVEDCVLLSLCMLCPCLILTCPNLLPLQKFLNATLKCQDAKKVHAQTRGVNGFSLIRQWSCSGPAKCHHACMTNGLTVLLFCDFDINIGMTLNSSTHYSACMLVVGDVKP